MVVPVDDTEGVNRNNGSFSKAYLPPERKYISYAGIVFIYLSALIFVSVVAYLSYRVAQRSVPTNISGFVPEFILSGIALITSLLGISLLKAGGLSESAPNLVINPKEWDLLCEEVKAGNEEAISQYIRLTSLTGFTGTFTKLGLSGLPLATIALTIFFSLLYLKNTAYIELAKLTLGAFIGSFVQKQVNSAQNAGTVTLPSGEKVKVTPSMSSPIA